MNIWFDNASIETKHIVPSVKPIQTLNDPKEKVASNGVSNETERRNEDTKEEEKSTREWNRLKTINPYACVQVGKRTELLCNCKETDRFGDGALAGRSQTNNDKNQNEVTFRRDVFSMYLTGTAESNAFLFIYPYTDAQAHNNQLTIAQEKSHNKTIVLYDRFVDTTATTYLLNPWETLRFDNAVG